MIIIDKKKQQKIHTRQIDIATYKGASDSLVIEGVLKDERLLESFRLTGEIHPPGTVHHMIIRIKVSVQDLVIEDVGVEMPTVPRKECRETLESLLPIKGIPIVAGFAAKVIDLAGGVKGCCHIMALLNAMAPAAVQGAWSAMARTPIDPATYIPVTMERVRNTCWVWRSDGSLMKEYNSMA